MAKILIIDDEDDVRAELRDRIEVMGHSVEEAGCVDDAFKLASEIAYDCVLLDLRIPRSYGKPLSIHHGRNLLQRIVAMTGAPPVIVITANGLTDHQLATDMFENGAKGFIAKPFDKEPVEEKITKQITAHHASAAADRGVKTALFQGGNLVMHEDRIELCGRVVGGTKGNALIRQILEHLSREGGNGRRISAQGKTLADAIGRGVGERDVASAIQGFRQRCRMEFGCQRDDVIVTHRTIGYQLADWIVFQLGSDERPQTQADQDQAAVMKELRRFKTRTRRQMADRLGISQVRVKVALSRLDDAKVIDHTGGGHGAVHFIREAAVAPPAASARSIGARRAKPARRPARG